GSSAGGFLAGGWPRSPRYRRFGAARSFHAAIAWSMSKRKSCRPCRRRVGTLSEWSCEREERAASALLTVEVTSPCSSDCAVWASAASQFWSGTTRERIEIKPVFATSSGLRADARFVQVIAGTIALKGTPATAAFQTSPPPSERPKAPI